MRLGLLLVALSALGASAAAQEPPALAVRASTLWTGTTILRDRLIVVTGGCVVEIAPGEASPPPGATIVDVEGAWVLPGLVLADATNLAPIEAAEESVTPAARAADAFDPYDRRPRTVASGILWSWLSPGRARLVPGQGAAARLAPAGPECVAVDGSGALHLVVTAEAYNPPAVYEPPVPPGPDNPIRPAARQFPTVRGGAFSAARELFARARGLRPGSAAGGDAPVPSEGDADLRPVLAVIDGRLRLRIRAERSADILGALDLAKSAGVPFVLEGGTEAWKHAAELAAAGASVVLRAGTPPSGKLDPPAPFPNDRGEPNPDAARILKDAGVKVALVPAADGGFADLLWYAGAAVSAGFTRQDALRAVTSGAAEVLGAASVAGKIESGRAADLVLYDQDPLDPAARPLLVVAGGRIVHDRRSEPGRPVAITARRIHTAAGPPIENGTVLVQDGKVVAAGRQVTIPPGAEHVRLPEGVVVPGFIDAGGQAGLRGLRDLGDGQVAGSVPLPALGLDQRPSAYFDPSFPDVRAAARSGVTTLVLSPSGGRPTAGVVSVVKTGGVAGAASVVRELGGLLLDYSGVNWSAEEEDKLRKQFEAGKKYVESFEKYEKDLAEWKKKNPAAAATTSEKKLEEVTVPEPYDAVTGTWEGEAVGEGLPGGRLKAKLDLVLEGSKVKGRVHIDGVEPDPITFEAELVDRRIVFEIEVEGQKVKGTGEFGRETFDGAWEIDGVGKGTFAYRRTARPEPKPKEAEAKKETPEKPTGEAAAPAAEPEGKPKAPKKQAALEPYKPILAGDLPVFLAVRNERLARRLIDLLRNELEVRTVLLSPELVPALLDSLDELGVALSPAGDGLLREEEGKLLAPATLAVRRRVPVLLRSGFGGDPRTLAPAAAYAVRAGVDPDDALKMVTAWSALVLDIQARVGTLERGKDADLLVLSGEPFQPGTRIERVMIDGKWVVEESR